MSILINWSCSSIPSTVRYWFQYLLHTLHDTSTFPILRCRKCFAFRPTLMVSYEARVVILFSNVRSCALITFILCLCVMSSFYRVRVNREHSNKHLLLTRWMSHISRSTYCSGAQVVILRRTVCTWLGNFRKQRNGCVFVKQEQGYSDD